MNFPPQDWALIIGLAIIFVFIVGTIIWLIQDELEYRRLDKLTEQKRSKEK